MSGKPSKQSGFTLVELLVTLVLFGMVITLSGTSYSWFASRWQQWQIRFAQQSASARQHQLVHQAVTATLDYHAPDIHGSTDRRIYFEGNAQGFRGVTLASLFQPDSPALYSLEFKASQDDLYSLEYREWPLQNLYLAQQKEVEEGLGEPFVWQLAEGLKQPRVDYYGWENSTILQTQGEEFLLTTSAATTVTEEPEATWHDNYSGWERGLLPERIRLRFSDPALEAGYNVEGVDPKHLKQEWLFMIPNRDLTKTTFFSGGEF
ncbi:MAG: prepilin-type N-terminal cleavage/methylation domain-containing protein [Magnetococcales bacterium]|nr:prepilin-type N-terminal cleavage/methylation domain-containing protein [Magnetococcales bacterium]